MPWVMRIHNVDNRLRVLVDGVQVFEQYYDFDPGLDIPIAITANAAPKPTLVQVQGFNGPMLNNGSNPWHFSYVFQFDGHDKLPIDRRSDASGGDVEKLVHMERYTIKGDQIAIG